MSLSTVSFLVHLDSGILWIPEEHLPLTYDLHVLDLYRNILQSKTTWSYCYKDPKIAESTKKNKLSQGNNQAGPRQHEAILKE